MGYIEESQRQKLNEAKAEKLDLIEQRQNMDRLVSEAASQGYEKGLGDLVTSLEDIYGGDVLPSKGPIGPGLAEQSVLESINESGSIMQPQERII